MQYMVESQDVLVENIDKTVESANVQLEAVNVELTQATEIAKRSRKVPSPSPQLNQFRKSGSWPFLAC